MDVYGNDMIYGNFKLSDYGLMLATFSLEDEEELGMDYEVVEEFVGYNPVPLYLGAKYTNKLEPTVTLIKNLCNGEDNPIFTEHECREVLRQLTGFRGYRQLQIMSDNIDELYYFNARTKRVLYRKYGEGIVAIVLELECDSQFAWSKEYSYTYNMTSGVTDMFINMSDDLYNYLLPTVKIIIPDGCDDFIMTNESDNDWETEIKNIVSGETITMDSKKCLLLSSKPGRYVLNDFNMHFIRFVSGKNVFKTNTDCTLQFTFRVPRKVGLV